MTAESCTSGLVCTALGAAEASTDFFCGGFVTYTGEAKMRFLGVARSTLIHHTAVSRETVCEMAQGAARLAGGCVSLAVSGYAGPGGGDDGTPAGTVWFAWQLAEGKQESCVKHFDGNCETVVLAAALFAIRSLTDLLRTS